MDVKLDSRGNIYIADTGNHRIRRIDAASGNITTVAAGTLNTPCAIALDANDDLYIVDWQNFLIRKVAFPSISPGGIVDGASFSAPPAPGGIFSIFGANLSTATEAFSTVPLPTTLAGVSLEINGAAVPLYLVSPGQINAQLPFDTAPGPATAVIVTPPDALPPRPSMSSPPLPPSSSPSPPEMASSPRMSPDSAPSPRPYPPAAPRRSTFCRMPKPL